MLLLAWWVCGVEETMRKLVEVNGVRDVMIESC